LALTPFGDDVSLLGDLIAQLRTLIDRNNEALTTTRSARDTVEDAGVSLQAALQDSSNPAAHEGLGQWQAALEMLDEVQVILQAGNTAMDSYITGPLLGGAAGGSGELSGSSGTTRPQGSATAASGTGYQATVGYTTSFNYKKTFFTANPGQEGKVVVHHAVEQQIKKRYQGLFSENEIHSLENLRGIPKGSVNNTVHLSAIRKEWNRFYRNHPKPTREQVLEFATEVDLKYGAQFDPPLDT
jgi:hypothetical protein